MSTAQQPLRLLIRFTNKYTYAQVIAHENGNVIAAASTLEKALRQPTGNTGKKVSAELGRILAARATQAGIRSVTWERKHGQKFHGRVAEFLIAMQDAGLALS